MTLSADDQQLSAGVGRVLGFLVGVTLQAADTYLSAALTRETPNDDDRRAILNGLLTVANAFRVADAQRELLDHLTDELDPKPALAVLRTVQDSLTLSLSDDPSDRSRRISEDELRVRLDARDVKRFLDLARTA